MKIKKIAVIGSNSFTGAHFVNYVLENTDAEVLGISRSPEYSSLFLPYLYKKKRPKRFHFHQLDVWNDFEKLINLLDAEKPEVVLNYAAQGEVRNSWKWPEQWFQTNCMAVVKLANALKDKDYLKRYVSISTPEVYGSTGKKIKENFCFNPSTPYAASKLSGDLFLMTLFKKYNFPVVTTRSANVYGMHQQLYRIIPRTIIYLKQGKKIQLHNQGETIRSFVHAKDVADGCWKAINRGMNGNAYHLAWQNQEITINELVKTICTMMKCDFKASTQILKENFGQDEMYSLDSSKAREKLGWKPQIALKQGIREMIKWIDDNWEEIQKQPLEYVHKA
jgi:dTDP-glucose 4,6-dehydratase